MSSFRLRSATRSDGPAVAEVVAALDLAILGRTEYSLAELEEEWRLLDVEHDAWVVAGERDRVIGYGTVDLRSDHAHDAFDPGLCAVVRAGGEIVGGTVCLPERLGVGWVSRLFTVREWRGRGIGAALLADAFGRFWQAGRRRVGLGVDAQSNTGAQRLYERAGMHVHFGAVVFERALA